MKRKLLHSCTNPQWVWRDKVNHKDAVLVPCGKCLACRFKASFAWKERIVFEMKTVGVDQCCFLTLTYDDAHCPVDGVRKRHAQNFMKRLRSHFLGRKIRFFLCAEYGSHTERPHYHAILFGVSRQELQSLCDTLIVSGVEHSCFDDGARVYLLENSSYVFNSLWPFGWMRIDSYTEGRASYVAGYVLKKSPRPDGKNKPFRLMSRRPGLGCEWILAHPDEVMYRPNLDDDFVTLSRYVEDKLYPKDSLKRMIRDSQKEKYLIKFHKLVKDYAAELGLSPQQVLRQVNNQVDLDLSALVNLRGPKHEV